MQNDMRDRLAELLSTNLYGNLCDHCGANNDFDKYKLLDMTADYLIANGVVPVVRCRDCKHYDIRNAKCLLHSELADQYSSGFNFEMYADDFCSYGERK